MIEYKGYIGRVEFDDDAYIFHGEVVHLRDVVTFQGETASSRFMVYLNILAQSPSSP